jgi:dTDP-4-dehydrorhamnose reductase
MKTMLRLAETRDEISVVSDQIGTPTYAGDLADVILKIISSKNTNFGLYHYSNEGQTSWYGFAKAIFEGSNLKIKTTPIKTEAYPTPAKRPIYSVMDKTKIKNTLKATAPKWQDSLSKILIIK